MNYQETVNQVKADIIVHVLRVMEKPEPIIIATTIEQLRKYAMFYRIHLINIPGNRPELNQSLRQFIVNGEGYSTTIKNLYNALLNAKESAAN